MYLFVCHDQVTKANSNVAELGTLANQLQHHYNKLAQNARGAQASTNQEVMFLPLFPLRMSFRFDCHAFYYNFTFAISCEFSL